MRTYPRNSPHAAARIVALALLADAHLSKTETEALERLQVARRLGLAPNELYAVLHDFCADLLATSHLAWSDACRIDEATLKALLDEIDEPALQRELLELCTELVAADGHLAEGEALVLSAAVARGWTPAAATV